MTGIYCDDCGKEIRPSKHAGLAPMWCGQTCRQRAWRRRKANGEPNGGPAMRGRRPNNGNLPLGEHSEEEWDGVSQFSARPQMLFPYVRHCLMCGRDTPVEWMTNERAGDLGRAGLSACPTCGGWRHMDPVETGGISSAIAAVPRHTVAEPVRPVRWRVA